MSANGSFYSGLLRRKPGSQTPVWEPRVKPGSQTPVWELRVLETLFPESSKRPRNRVSRNAFPNRSLGTRKGDDGWRGAGVFADAGRRIGLLTPSHFRLQPIDASVYWLIG